MHDMWWRFLNIDTSMVNVSVVELTDEELHEIKDLISAEISRREEDKMAAKKTETREDMMGANLILTFAELRYLKSLIRQKIICYESRKYDERWAGAGKKYTDYSGMEKARMDSDLEICYEIFDHLLKVGIREDVI